MMTLEELEQAALTVMTPGEHAMLDALRDMEARFFKAEARWAKEGSGQTPDQQTGAHMAFMWLRTQRPVFASAVTPELLAVVAAARRLASWDEMAGRGDPEDWPEVYRAELRARINLAKEVVAALDAKDGAS